MQPLAGVDLSVDNLQLSTETLGRRLRQGHDHQRRDLREHAHGRDVEAVAGRDQTTSNDTREGRPRASSRSSSDLPTFVVTVRHDGRWYVSPAYTALEYAREADGGPAAEFGSAKAADLGADTPENAVSDALHALQAGNWDRLMALAPPDELPVYDYRNWIDEVAADDAPRLHDRQALNDADVNGDTAIVKLDASGTTGSGSDEGKWQVGGTCPAYGRSRYGVA